MSFSPEEDIESAFSRLSASVTSIIEDSDFLRLKRAAIERVKSPKMIQRSNELVPIIDEAKSFQDLCTTLAKTSYWNFLDIRMMDAMAIASLIPAAQQSIENFKKTFFGMTLAEAAPYFPIISLKSGHTVITERLDKDPSKMTIFELHKHRFYLETELLQTGPNTCTICTIVIGSVMITWQIHADHALHAYCSLKKKHSLLPLQGIVTLSVEEAEVYEGLPIMWRGQEVTQIGPIEPLPQQVQQKPIPLHEGLQWVPFDISRLQNDALYEHMVCPMMKLIQWANCHPFNPTKKEENMPDSLENEWSFAIKDTYIDKIIGCMQWCLMHIQVGGTVLKLFHLILHMEAKRQITNLMFTEVFRRVNLHGISQGLMFSENTIGILKPVVTLTRWCYNFLPQNNLPLDLLQSPKIPGWRPMTSKDIPSALALTNKYSSQFEIGQVFQSEEEFSYFFMCPVMKNYMQAFVVEDPVTGDITDVAGFKLERDMFGRYTFAFITILVPMKSPPRQILIDLLVCAKEAKADLLFTFQFGLAKEKFKNILMITETTATCHCYLINYRYNEVDEDQVCLFCC